MATETIGPKCLQICGMVGATREALQRRASLAAITEWEKQHGSFSVEEMEEARRSVRAQLRTSRTARRPA